jgi:hypothetical protein
MRNVAGWSCVVAHTTASAGPTESEMTFKGACHCGKLAYTVDEDTTKGMECNCSICRRRAALHHFTTPDKFTLNGSQDDISTYVWNKQAIHFEFCKSCGIAPFAHGTGPSGPMVEINVRCIEGIDLDAVEIEKFDGAHKL